MSFSSSMRRRLRSLARTAVREVTGRGDVAYVAADGPLPASGAWCVDVRPGSQVDADAIHRFCGRQTLRELRWTGSPEGTASLASVGCDAEVLFVYAPSRLPDVAPAWLESAAMVLAAEGVDAVCLAERSLVAEALGSAAPPSAAALGEAPWRDLTLFRAASWTFAADPADLAPTIRPVRHRTVVKWIGPDGVEPLDAHGLGPEGRRRRGPYLTQHPLGARLTVEIHDAARLARRPAHPGSERQPLVVTSPFFARGGAEHTLYETLRVLLDRFDLTFATLAPHRAELGDRRDDFAELAPRLLSLGDLVHPAAMPGILASLFASVEHPAERTLWHNTNGTTLFYDFVGPLGERLAQAGRAPIVSDHLYDHRVGYIDRYDGTLDASIDLCVAENRRIHDELVGARGWSAERVPVIWPCGRARDAFAPEDERPALRQRIRRELGYTDDDVLVLTAARMHEQKRPLDLVRLAERLADAPSLAFLVVGGGPLEDEVDAAIAESQASLGGARIRRLPFRTDIPDLIVAADAGCLVSAYEGLPVFLLECLQAGRPFLGTNVGDLGWVLHDTGAGWVVERPGDLDALEAAARALLDPSARAERAARARAAGPRFAVEECAERYAAAFRGPAVRRSAVRGPASRGRAGAGPDSAEPA